MGIRVKCVCKRRWSPQKKKCDNCGADLDNLKKSGKARYWVYWYIPGTKRKASKTVDNWVEALALDGEKKEARYDGAVSKLQPDSRATFKELTEWYLTLKKVESLAMVKSGVQMGDTVYIGEQILEWTE